VEHPIELKPKEAEFQVCGVLGLLENKNFNKVTFVGNMISQTFLSFIHTCSICF